MDYVNQEKISGSEAERYEIKIKDSGSLDFFSKIREESSLLDSKALELYDCLATGGSVDMYYANKDEEEKILFDYLYLSPIYNALPFFNAVHFLAAGVERSPFLVVGSYLGIQFKPSDKSLWPAEERLKHKSELITLVSGAKGRPGLTKLGENNGALFRDVVTGFKSWMELNGISPCLYSSNHNKAQGSFKSWSDDILKNKRSERVPYIASGVNTYAGLLDENEIKARGLTTDNFKDGFNAAIWLGMALLSNTAKGQIQRYVESFEGDAKEIIDSIENFATCEAAYQMLCRTVIRNVNNTKPVKLFVLSDYIADYLEKNYFAGAKVERLSIECLSEAKTKVNLRTVEVLELWRAGYKRKEIAEKCNVSLKTVQRTIKSFKEAA